MASSPETATSAAASTTADEADDASYVLSSILPALLIVTAALILTNSIYLFQLAPARERLRITLLLWLTASLQHHEHEVDQSHPSIPILSTYETIVWLSLILQIAVQHILTTTVVGFGFHQTKKKDSRYPQQSQSQQSLSPHRQRSWCSTPFMRWWILAATNSLVWATWVALVLETVGFLLPANPDANPDTYADTDTNTNVTDVADATTSSYHYYLYSRFYAHATASVAAAAKGCLCWVALMLHEYRNKRKRAADVQKRQMQQQHQQPYTADTPANEHDTSLCAYCCASSGSGTTNSNTTLPDERFWYTWTSRQVLEWMAAYQPPVLGDYESRSRSYDDNGSGSDNRAYNYTSSGNQYATRDNEYDNGDNIDFWNDDNDNNISINAVWISCLAAEGLQGTHLDQLVCTGAGSNGNTGTTVADMHRDTGMPYGPAAALLQAVRDLTTRHERPMNRTDHGDIERADGAATSSWLTQHDQEYGYTSAATKYTNDNHDNSNQGNQRQRRRPGADNEIDPEMATKAQNLMTERFGLELPEMRLSQQNQPTPQQQSPLHDDLDPNPPRDYGEDTASLSQEDPLSDSAATQMNADLWKKAAPIPSSSLMDFPPEFLANMPPHLSEIIRRKPELVQQILASRQKEAIMSAPTPVTTPFLMQQQQSQSQSLGGGTVRNSHQSGALFTNNNGIAQRPPRLGAVAEDEEENIDLLSANTNYQEPARSGDDGDDEWGDNDGERTTLLRNRKREPSQSKQYKSIQ
jgi:hypothetical protein